MTASNFLRAMTLAAGVAALTATAATSRSVAPPVVAKMDATADATVVALQSHIGQSYIVQARSAAEASRLVLEVGGTPLSPLPLINAAGARLTPSQLVQLQQQSVRVYQDRRVETAAAKTRTNNGKRTTSTTTVTAVAPTTTTSATTTSSSSTTSAITTTSTLAAPTSTSTSFTSLLTSLASAATTLVTDYSSSISLTSGTSPQIAGFLYEPNYAMLVGADLLHPAGITGAGVTIAVLDSGLWQNSMDAWGSRVLAKADFVGTANGAAFDGDANGHGTHITSVAASGRQNITGSYYGIAPKANVVVARAFAADGSASYLDVIKALDWIVANRAKYNIRVLNLSFGATPQSYYWDDPLNQAVMRAWQAGIVVVASAGNAGPTPMSIGVPGNVPYVITTGALTDNFTPYEPADDKLASFSSTGPTYEGFVKPEVVAPGGHIVASMPAGSYLVNLFGVSMQPYQTLFTMSGTSQAAAVTTGVVALMLQANPALTPDDVKCRLMAAARPAVRSDGTLAYSVFQQGTGLVNAAYAVNSTATGCANAGLNITADLDGSAHFGGPANIDANGNYYVMDMDGSTWGGALGGDGYTWSRAYSGTQGYTWSQGYVWSKGYVWSRGYTWTQGYVWSRGYTWSQGYVWSRSLTWTPGLFGTNGLASPLSVDPWVNQE